MKIEGKLYLITDLLVCLISVMCAAVCFLQDISDGLWILPAVFFFLYFICLFGKRYKKNYNIVLILGIAFVRYVILPFLYYFINSDAIYDLGDNRIVLRYVSNSFFNKPEVILIMLIEMTAIFSVITLFGRKYSVHELKPVNTAVLGMFSSVLLVAGIIAIILLPQLVGIYAYIKKISYISPSYLGILYQTALILIELVLTCYIYERKTADLMKYVLTLLLWVVCSFENAVSSSGGISRWGFVINFLIGIVILMRLYPQYIKKTLFSLGGIGLAVVIFMSTYKHMYEGDTAGRTLSRLFSYKTVNAYFDGPTNLAYAVKMSEENSITPMTMTCDIFRNMPIVNHYLPTERGTPNLFAKAINAKQSVDQIVPLSGQAYAYFSYAGVFVWNVVLVFGALWSGYRGMMTRNILVSFVYHYLAIVTSIGLMLNMTIIFQFIWIKMIPIAVLGILEYNHKIKTQHRHYYITGKRRIYE